jgi:hypothetical protein
MALKQFLKPDWRKIVIFVILFIVISFFPIYPCQLDVGYWEEKGGYTKTVFYPIWYVIQKGFNWGFKSEPLEIYSCNELFILIFIILFYLLSCLII